MQREDNYGSDGGHVNGAEKGQPRQERQPDAKPASKRQRLSEKSELPAKAVLTNYQQKEPRKKQQKPETKVSQSRSETKKVKPGHPGRLAEPVAEATAEMVALANLALNDSDAPSEDAGVNIAAVEDGSLETLDFSGLSPEADVPGLLSPPVSTPVSSPGSPTFDTNRTAKHASTGSTGTATSTSSTDSTERPKLLKLPADTSALRARIGAKIEALRAARRADVEGKPIRTRQELIEARRVKQAERKAHKKELRRQTKLEEEQKREEALASARTSPGSMLSPLVGLGVDGESAANHFSFGRVAFDDGTQMSHDLSYVKDSKKKRGPASNDAKAQLAIVEGAKKRTAGLDEDKRKEVLEKETWLAARKRAEGTKVRDDEALLKKAVKRKEKSKKKSEHEWKERANTVDKSIKDRQKKREDNIRKRKEDKMSGKAKKKGPKVKKGRAGFEGTFGGGGRRK